MEFHAITARGSMLIGELVDGRLVIPPAPPAAGSEGQASQPCPVVPA